ncbi:DUF5991 domain-containing protein [Chryseobacterium sp. PMSZPI]|uniref:DUF5991 domain-containing protein n=1 Tax=Chryseobacterium sp. PMSZPI TaxID=1033900 RepID=UPI0039A1DC8F
MKNLIIIYILSLFSCEKAKESTVTISKEVGWNKKLPGDSLVSESEINISKSQKISDNHWLGNYNLNIDYGKLDNVSEMSIDYDIEINNDKCTFSGMGYKTYFTDLCKIEESGKQLILKYEKAIDGDGFSDHSNLTTLGTILYKEGKYYLKSPIVADKKWNYNSELVLTKKD